MQKWNYCMISSGGRMRFTISILSFPPFEFLFKDDLPVFSSLCTKLNTTHWAEIAPEALSDLFQHARSQI